MSSLNKVMLIGNLGRDPEVRFTPDGSPVATFSIATGETWTDKSGTRQERTEWHNIVAWNKLADLAKRYLSKGRQVYIEGRIRTREWDDRDGNKRRTTEVIATQMVLLGSRPQGSDAAPVPQPVQKGASADIDQGMGDAGITDEDIPF
jgi:single-strand DNA-binding protein